MTKLLISLPLSDAAQRFYGSSAPTYNKVGDAGIDLPFVREAKPYDAGVVETIGVISFETVFAMYEFSKVKDTCTNPTRKFDFIEDVHNSLRVVEEEYERSHFDIRPRSSISKTPFRLANAVGTIDKTYRGIECEHIIDNPDINETYWSGDTLGCYLDYHPQLGKARADKHVIYEGDRLLQVVAPSLDDILHIRLDFTEENCVFWSEVIGNKNRGGFGSTSVGTNG